VLDVDTGAPLLNRVINVQPLFIVDLTLMTASISWSIEGNEDEEVRTLNLELDR